MIFGHELRYLAVITQDAVLPSDIAYASAMPKAPLGREREILYSEIYLKIWYVFTHPDCRVWYKKIHHMFIGTHDLPPQYRQLSMLRQDIISDPLAAWTHTYLTCAVISKFCVLRLAHFPS